jgi:putative Mg2+ transporter-C (MgtC) family protein
MLQEIWSTVVAEFSDIPDVATVTKITVRILIAAVLGGILGYEREQKSKSAGVRTHMLVAVGAAIFMVGPTQAGMALGDLSRVIQGAIQGIGFLGAGAIIIGIAAGLGIEATAVLSTIIVLFVLSVVPLFIRRADKNSSDAANGTDHSIDTGKE